ncbi:MAG: 2-oxo acid dehydrogenase subunit E2 [Acidobacteriota bacterium]|nr:2-oxo acid dehydrogenase subunit E2 [Acidobacteriota bacterium]
MKHQIIMPDLGQTTEEGKIVRWLKRPGDKIAQGDQLLEVETDKVTMEVESYKAGYLRALLVNEGEMASAMAPIAILTDEPEEAYEGAAQNKAEAVAEPDSRLGRTSPSTQFAPDSENPAVSSSHTSSHPGATPAARNRARELGVNWHLLTNGDPNRPITRRDVENTWQKRHASLLPSPMAAITAKSATEIPHFYVTVDAEVSRLLQWRGCWNETRTEYHASLNDVFVRVASLALKDVPALNVHYRDGQIETKTTADILLVAAVETGLRLVSIPDPSLSSWEEHLRAMQQALNSIRQNRVMSPLVNTIPALAVSNLGMFGVKQFTAIIPPECTAVLAVGAVREAAIVRNKQLKMEDVCTLTLACDHRVVDGITAAKFLERFQMYLRAL